MADKKVGVVRYTMAPTTREITKQQWEDAGVKNQDATVWSKLNGWAIPVDQFNKAAMAVISGEEGFRVDEDPGN